ncbi:MAG: exonuclease SbcCD subunit D [Archaeoglobales archaeon]|nr:exonuclease SbcCD subunit D [Archaeoglobales archaeon]
MRFAHFADIHLGYEQYNQPWRAEDITNAFRLAAKKAVEEKVDFVVISGDLFHRSYPTPKTIKDAIEILEIFKEQKIPVFAVEGNHDRSVRDMSAYHLLEKLGLLTILGLRKNKIERDNVLCQKIGDVYFVKGIYEGIEIVGESYKTRWRIDRIKPLLKPSTSESILVLHQAVKEVIDIELEIAYELTLNDLPKARYYALGHVHLPKILEFDGSYVVYPGSIERYDAREASIFVDYSESLVKREGCKKGFVVVDNFKPKFIEIKTRNLLNFVVNGENYSEVEKKTSELAKFAENEDLVVLKILCREEIDVKKLTQLFSSVKHLELRFERLREKKQEFKEIPAENQFFNEFELKLLEILREESEALRGSAIEIIKEHFGLGEFKSLKDFSEIEKSGAEKGSEKVEVEKEKKETKKIDSVDGKKKPKTLLDFLGD